MDRKKLDQLAHSHINQEKYAVLPQATKETIVSFAVMFLEVATYQERAPWSNKQVEALRNEQRQYIKESAKELKISYDSLDLYILGTCRKVHEMITRNIQDPHELEKIRKRERKSSKQTKYAAPFHNPGSNTLYHKNMINNDYYGGYTE